MRKIIRTILCCLPFLALFLILAELFVTNELAGLGVEVQKIDTKIDQVREENVVLSQLVASASSLLTVQEKARELGFTQSPNYIVLGREEFALHQPQ